MLLSYLTIADGYGQSWWWLARAFEVCRPLYFTASIVHLHPRFIKNHFADLFRIIPESPERLGIKEQRWLSASTLRRDSETSFTRIPPGTPESLPPSLPSFALSTPEGTRASTVHTPSPNASPLTPLQFIRRAGLDQTELSLTLSTNMNKSKPNTPPPPLRTRRSTTNSHSKVIWRP